MDDLIPDRVTAGGSTTGPPAPAAARGLGELLLAMQADDRSVYHTAWEECARAHHRQIFHYALVVLRRLEWRSDPREDALEVASDVLGRLRDYARTYVDTGEPRSAEAWLRKVTTRRALRRIEQLTGRWGSAGAADGGGRDFIELDDAADEILIHMEPDDPEDRIERRGRMDALHGQIDALRRSPESTKRRWAEFLDLYIAGYGYPTIAQRLGIGVPTAHNWHTKILKHLRESLGGA